ncbi:hypothetical protein HW532_04195 [Kaustia mangrovi]|uniref:Holin of 3TMs, for gene-transfer release n=1 Tax=Kaustia mangrovi TaxID=2593653 RepID=A0A7S8HBA8_9HYPH|nr:3TM-type holin [Kaustia mangrovi]QPC41983.1 hypothetical protein HW532_04195 [Kaustia mangrovi]
MISAIAGLLTGPLLDRIVTVVKAVQERRIGEAQARAEIEKALADAEGQIARVAASVVVAELSADSWLTRNWRPCLMFLGMFLLVFFGVLLPAVNLMLPEPLAFQPLWDEIPDGIWEMLKWGIGGYIGGRSLEKVATLRTASAPPASGFGRRGSVYEDDVRVNR